MVRQSCNKAYILHTYSLRKSNTFRVFSLLTISYQELHTLLTEVHCYLVMVRIVVIHLNVSDCFHYPLKDSFILERTHSAACFSLYFSQDALQAPDNCTALLLYTVCDYHVQYGTNFFPFQTQHFHYSCCASRNYSYGMVSCLAVPTCKLQHAWIIL